MFSFPPFKQGSVFDASQVVSGIQLVSPSHGHEVDETTATTRNHFFRMALHPYSMHILDNAANSTNTENFMQSIQDQFLSLSNAQKRLYQTLRQATNFVPVAVGQYWLLAKDSPLIKLISPWQQAKEHINAISSMLEEYGMLQVDTFDNEAGVCAIRYYDMVNDLSKLSEIIQLEIRQGTNLNTKSLRNETTAKIFNIRSNFDQKIRHA